MKYGPVSQYRMQIWLESDISLLGFALGKVETHRETKSVLSVKMPGGLCTVTQLEKYCQRLDLIRVSSRDCGLRKIVIRKKF
jgi:hypothetical protein